MTAFFLFFSLIKKKKTISFELKMESIHYIPTSPYRNLRARDLRALSVCRRSTYTYPALSA